MLLNFNGWTIHSERDFSPYFPIFPSVPSISRLMLARCMIHSTADNSANTAASVWCCDQNSMNGMTALAINAASDE